MNDHAAAADHVRRVLNTLQISKDHFFACFFRNNTANKTIPHLHRT